MDETELRKHRCCFTGHRPEKLKIAEKQLVGLLEAEIRKAIAGGFTTFITGMARGTPNSTVLATNNSLVSAFAGTRTKQKSKWGNFSKMA